MFNLVVNSTVCTVVCNMLHDYILNEFVRILKVIKRTGECAKMGKIGAKNEIWLMDQFNALESGILRTLCGSNPVLSAIQELYEPTDK